MRKIIFTGLVAMVLFNVTGAYACVFADDPVACRAREHCDSQGALKPFCYMGATHPAN
ncbi:hypothetical protein [Pseudochrobactrum sp. MP213Fo]|uniref:hypothetical protein n=1 Tax=Pseudochrobactrum sp. MP213Fo TaxID=3022250 RepID=UPI003B9FDC85